jgi:BolA protein
MSKGSIEKDIINTLISKMKLLSLKIINESFMHNVPIDSESHFKILIVSNEFNNLSLLDRHKIIYKNLGSLMKKIHALSIHAYNEEEFKSNPVILKSPECANK